jgi:uncharacterized protein (TIGR02246 family)
MNVLRTVLVAAALLFVTPGLALAGEMEDRVAAAYSAWDTAFNSGDPKAVAAFYTDDATFLPADHQVIEGPAGVENFFSGLFANGLTGHKLEMIKVVGAGDILVGSAKWSAQGKDASGKAATFGGVATHVFEKQADGNYKLKIHTFN